MFIETVILLCTISVPADCGKIVPKTTVVTTQNVSFTCTNGLSYAVKVPANDAHQIEVDIEVRGNDSGIPKNAPMISVDCQGMVP